MYIVYIRHRHKLQVIEYRVIDASLRQISRYMGTCSARDIILFPLGMPGTQTVGGDNCSGVTSPRPPGGGKVRGARW